jgi:P22 coat protein - gene protein 5
MSLNQAMFSRMVGKVVKGVRESCQAPRLVNRDFAADLAKSGASVDVSIANPVPARPIVPANIPPADTPEASGTTVNVTLDNAQEAPFFIDDLDLSKFEDPKSFINRQLDQSARTIANAVDGSILDLYKMSPFLVGTPGTTPFATSTKAIQDSELVLIQNLAPMGDRKLLLDPFAYTNALGLPQFQNAASFGNASVIQEGRIQRAVGYDWGYSQNMKYHQRGALGGLPLTSVLHPVGSASIATFGWLASVVNILG